MSELTLEQELAKAKDELETAKATVKFYEDQVEQQAEWEAEDAKIAAIAAKFPWIFSTHLGAKPIDPVLRAQDDADPDDWDWETGAPKAKFMAEKLGHPVTEDEAMACLAYYKAFNAGERGMPRPTFAKSKDQSILGEGTEPIEVGPRGQRDVGGQEVSEYTGLDSAKPSAPGVPFEAGELEYRDIEYSDGRKMKSLVLPVKILEYPDGFDQMIGRSWITKDSHVSLSALEARLAGMRYTETMTNAPELTFILSSSYKWQDMSPVKLTFYFRKKDVMLKKSEGFELTREVPGSQAEQMPLPLPPVAEDYVKKEDLDTAVDRAVRKAIEQL